jgi:23S rRNA pseudoU1915 N3-methylase RlmH
MIRRMVTKIRIVAIGKLKESYLLEAIGEYVKRLVPFCRLELVELKDEGLAKEAKLLERYLGAAHSSWMLAGSISAQRNSRSS